MVDAFFEQSYCRSKLIASTRAAIIVKLHRLSNEDRMDFCQEALLELWRKTPVFNPSRASWRTYAERVIANRLTSCMRGVRARWRGHGWVEPIDGLKGAHYQGDDADLRIDVQRVLGALLQFDRAVAVSLSVYSPSDTCQRLRVARSTVYRSIKRLRAAFTAAGYGAAESSAAIRQHSGDPR